MPDTVSSPPPPRPDIIGWTTFKTRFRSRIAAGLILVVPIWITVVLARFVFGLLRDASLWMVEWYLVSPGGRPLLESWGVTPEGLNEKGLDALPTALQWTIGALSVLLTVVLIYILGAVTTNVVGRQAIHVFEALLGRVPLVKTVYRASKQMLDTFAGESAKPFQRVVSIPFPTPEIRSVGFVTGTSRDAATGEELDIVILANPMTGFIFVVKRSEAIELDWSVEEAVKMMMSGGMLTPEVMPFRGGAKRLETGGGKA